MGTKTYKAGRLFESDDVFTIGEILIGGWDGAKPFRLDEVFSIHDHIFKGRQLRWVEGTYLDPEGYALPNGLRCRFLTDNDGDEGICRAI